MSAVEFETPNFSFSPRPQMSILYTQTDVTNAEGGANNKITTKHGQLRQAR